jgi:hypothetical protein
VTWTKLGDEFSDEARDLSDAAYRTHVDALCWSNRRQLDLVIPKRDLRRFGETDDPDTAAKELVHGGWWEDRGDAWWIGCRFADWQQESVVIAKRREQSATTTRRSRLHKVGDHSLCLAKHCTALAGDTSQDVSRDLSPGSGRDGSVRDSSKSSSGAAPTPEGLGGRGAGEGGPGGEATAYPEQCSRHQHGDHDDPCGACGRARTAHRERQAAEQAARAREEAERPDETCSLHLLTVPCRGCAADTKAAA